MPTLQTAGPMRDRDSGGRLDRPLSMVNPLLAIVGCGVVSSLSALVSFLGVGSGCRPAPQATSA
jgi:hypothetical protein